MSRTHALTLAAICTGILAVKATPVRADVFSSGPASGPYIGAGYGAFNLRIDDLNDVGTAVSNIAHSTSDDAFKATAGYRFLPFLAVEANYMNFGSFHDSFVGTGANGNYNLHVSGFAPFVVGTLPAGPVELFAKAGYLYYDDDLKVNFNAPGTNFIESDHDRSNFIYGGGIGVTFFGHLNINAEYDQIRIVDARDSNAMWLSAAWRF